MENTSLVSMIKDIVHDLYKRVDELSTSLPLVRSNINVKAYNDICGLAKSILKSRRVRDRFFGPDLFAAPDFDILIDLFIQQTEGRRVTITSACLAAGVPHSTALRWLGLLGDRGLVSRTPSDQDRRLVYLSLTDDGMRRVAEYLSYIAG